jgi:hypothetical protein
MDCPNCNMPFQPEISNHLIGFNDRGKRVLSTFKCVLNVKNQLLDIEKREKERYVLSSEVEGLILLNNKVTKL